MKPTSHLMVITLPLSIALSACANWDNPTALSKLELDVEFEMEATRVETFEEVEIHVHVLDNGSPTRGTQKWGACL